MRGTCCTCGSEWTTLCSTLFQRRSSGTLAGSPASQRLLPTIHSHPIAPTNNTNRISNYIRCHRAALEGQGPPGPLTIWHLRNFGEPLALCSMVLGLPGGRRCVGLVSSFGEGSGGGSSRAILISADSALLDLHRFQWRGAGRRSSMGPIGCTPYRSSTMGGARPDPAAAPDISQGLIP